MNEALVITAFGAVTPVGAGAAQTCASVRATLSGLRRHPTFYAALPQPVRESPSRISCGMVLDAQVRARSERLLQMAVLALRDLILGASLDRASLQGSEVLVCLGGTERDAEGIDPKNFARGLSRRVGVSLPCRVQACDASAVLSALATALSASERTIVLAVDSLADELSLRWFDDRDRLRSDRTLDGLIAGEAAACVLIERADAARRRRVAPLARLGSVGTGVEENVITGEANSTAAGLCAAIRAAVASWSPPRADWVIADLTGEGYGAYEWGLASARLGSVLGSAELWHPADCTGAVGAAAPLLAVAIAAQALSRGYAPSHRALVLCGVEGTARAACALEVS